MRNYSKKIIKVIRVKTNIKADIKKIWELWTNPEDIKQWYHATDDWYVPKAVNKLKVRGKFIITMSSVDKKQSFDFVGTYSKIVPFKSIEYTIQDGRKVETSFTLSGINTQIAQIFQPESIYTIEQQRSGWQSILDNFRKYVENKVKYKV